MNQKIEIRLVKHIYPGYGPLLEIQRYSDNMRKWYMVHTSNNQASIDNFLKKYYPGLDCPVIDCLHERER